MREITKREKTLIGIGVLSAVVILVWFVLLPIFQREEGPKQTSSIEEMQEKLTAVEELAGMGSVLVDLEEKMGEESGYKKVSFKRGNANPAVINYIAQAAKDAGIGELEQLDARPETRKSKQTGTRGRQDVLAIIVDRMYMKQTLSEMQQDASGENDNTDEDEPVGGPAQLDQQDSDPSEENGDMLEEDSDLADEADALEDQNDSHTPDEPGVVVPEEDIKQTKPTGAVFPPIPRGIPDEVRKSLVKSIEARQGTTLGLEDISNILDEAGLLDSERPGVSKRLQLYNDGVKKKKSEVRRSLSKLGVSPNTMLGQTALFKITDKSIEGLESDGISAPVLKKLENMRSYELANERDFMNAVGQEIGPGTATKFKELILKHARKTDAFTIKMVFKGQIDQLVKFMYNLSDSARWLTVDSMRVGISDRRETVLSVELSMTAIALYDI